MVLPTETTAGTGLWDGDSGVLARRRSPRSTRSCRLCGHAPDGYWAEMFRVCRSESSSDPGRIAFWLCPDCMDLVVGAIDAAKPHVKQRGSP